MWSRDWLSPSYCVCYECVTCAGRQHRPNDGSEKALGLCLPKPRVPRRSLPALIAAIECQSRYRRTTLPLTHRPVSPHNLNAIDVVMSVVAALVSINHCRACTRCNVNDCDLSECDTTTGCVARS